MKIPTTKSPILFLTLIILIFTCSIAMALLGGIKDTHGFQNNEEIQDLARFAVAEHNNKQNVLLEFARVVKAKQQVVAGTLHHLTVEVIESGAKKLYEAKVWVKPWMQFKELTEFKLVGEVEEDSSSAGASAFTAADLGGRRGGHEPGWRTVPAHDPTVQDAASHAVKTIQQRSNSLSPYELLEILHAKAEVIEDLVKYNLLLKLKRGNKEENFNVEVHKKPEGTYHLNLMQLEQPNVTTQ